MKHLIFLILIFVFASCSNQFSLQKRRYTKGFYFARNHHIDKTTITKKLETSNDTKQIPGELEIVTLPLSQISKCKISTLKTVIENHTRLNVHYCYQLKPSANQSIKFVSKQRQLGKSQTIKRFEPKDNLLNKVIYIALCFLAGLCFVFGLGVLILFLSTLNNYYLMLTIILLALAVLFYFIADGMNQS